MSLLGKMFGQTEGLTPEELAAWIVSLQRPFFGQLYNLLKQDRNDLQPINIPIEAVPEIAFHAYLCHLAVVAIVYHEHLDDSKILQGGPATGTPLFAFAERVHEHGRKLVEPELKLDSGLNPFPVAPFAVEFEKHVSNFAFYYGSFFTELGAMRDARPAAVEYAETMIAEMKTDNLLVKPISVAYYQAHQLLFPPGNWKSKYNRESPDMYALSVVLRTWQPWCVYFINLPATLRSFVGERTPAF